MESLAETLQRAWQMHQRGQYGEAETIYRRILDFQPTDHVALFLLGRLELETGRQDQAAEHLTAAVERNGSQAVYHATLARAQQATGRHREAVAAYRAAIALEPGAADYYVNLGTSLLYCKEAHEAIACYEKAIERDPEMAEAYVSLGAAVEHQGRADEAIAHYRKAIELKPTYAQAHYNLGTALVKRGRAAEALHGLNAAAQLQPRWAAALANLAAAYHMLGREDEACESIRGAIILEPDEPDHHSSLATVLRYQGRPHDALASYSRALELDPAHAEADYGRALALLSLGRFREAWSGFERRLALNPAGSLQLDEPRWDGSPLADRTLLVHAEGGASGTIQFVRLVKLADQRGGNVVLAVQGELMTLLAESGYRGLVSRDGPLGPFDVQVPMMSLAGVLDLDLDAVPRDVPYLGAAPGRIEKWRGALVPFRGLKVGIAWHDAVPRDQKNRHSIPLDCLAPLAEVRGVDFISLQIAPPGDSDGQGAPLEIASLEGLDGGAEGFADVAAVMKGLDLVIAADTPVAHLAGALGVPAWIALDKGADWRWLVDRDDSPWYPTMRLFRQESPGDWYSVVDRIAIELGDLVRRRGSPANPGGG